MTDRDSHDDWRLLNWAYKFPDEPCRYNDGVPIPITYGVPRFAGLLPHHAPPIEPVFDWSDHENSDPFADVSRGIAAYRAASDRPPSKLVISPRLWAALMTHPLVLERLKFTTPDTQVTPALLAQLFDVADVIVTD